MQNTVELFQKMSLDNMIDHNPTINMIQIDELIGLAFIHVLIKYKKPKNRQIQDHILMCRCCICSKQSITIKTINKTIRILPITEDSELGRIIYDVVAKIDKIKNVSDREIYETVCLKMYDYFNIFHRLGKTKEDIIAYVIDFALQNMYITEKYIPLMEYSLEKCYGKMISVFMTDGFSSDDEMQ